MKGASTVHGFKRSLESAGQQQHANGGGARPGGERRRIGFHKARNPKNGFVSLSTLKAGAAGGASQHGKVRVRVGSDSAVRVGKLNIEPPFQPLQTDLSR